MIYSFTFKNFCSFADEATISFEDIRRGVETDNNLFCNTPAGARLSKVMMLVGPNASGKTNALKALAFLRWFVAHSFMGLEGENTEIPIDTFGFTDEKDNVSEFEIVFEYKKVVYKYALQVSPKQVIKEELYRREETRRFNYLFKRQWNPKTEKSEIDQTMDLQTEALEKILRRNVSLISTSVAIKNDLLTEIAGFWGAILTNVDRAGWDISSFGAQALMETSKFYDDDPNLFGRAKSFLKDMDLGLEDISIDRRQEPDAKSGREKTIYSARGVHKAKTGPFQLPFAFESSGTKSMFILLSKLLPVLENGGIAVIDELEMDLHPHTLPPILNLFADPATNPHNSQLIFTSHSLDVLNRLEKEQIILVDKKEGCESELYRLDEVEDVRRTDNFQAKYLAGAYGAVPNI